MDILFRYVVTALLLALLTSSEMPRAHELALINSHNYKWTKVLEQGPWKKSYNFQLFSHHDTLWVFHPDGNWFSTNGKTWEKSILPNAIHNLAFLDYVQFKNTILGLGHFEGNIEKYTLKPEIYQTQDMKHWKLVAKQSNLPQRFFCHPFVFQNKIWLVGGENNQTQFADIWNSPDGIHWQKVKDNLPFGKRSNSQVVYLGGKLYLLNNDVWSSADGLNWQLETPEIVKGVAVFGYAAVVLDSQIWLLGCNRNGQFTSKILVSSDGHNWQEQNAPWSPRGGIAACTHLGKIYMTGGKYGGQDISHPDFVYSNDLWVLSAKD